MGLWYFSLWALGFTGAEVSGLTVFAVAFLGIKKVRQAVHLHSTVFWLIAILFGLMLAGNVEVAGFSAQATPELRLIFLTIGTGSACLLLPTIWSTSQFSGHGNIKFLLGLLSMVAVKIAFCTHNPAWPLMNESTEGKNLLCSFFALVAVFGRNKPQKPTKEEEEKKETKTKETPLLCSFDVAIAFGTVLFWTHTYLTDTESIGRWIVRGVPETGPSSLLGGLIVFFSMLVGTFVGLFQPKFALSREGWLIGTISIILFYGLPPITADGAFAAGSLFAFYVCSLWNGVLLAMQRTRIAKALFMGMAFFMVLTLMQIYTVAYAFVPFGNILRERTWFVIGTCVIAMFSTRKTLSKVEALKISPSFLSGWIRNILGALLSIAAFAVMVRLQAPFYSGIHFVPLAPESSSLVDSSLTGTLMEFGGLPVVTAGIWTIHFGLDMDMFSSHVRMKNLIEGLNLDVIGLLESDTERVVMGNRDVVQYLAESLNMFADYGPSTRDHTWGCAMLSKYPILKSTHFLLPSPNGELACAIHATTLINDRHVDFFISHNGQEEDKLDRILQTTEISRIINSSSNPLVFLGYVVASPHSSNYYLLMRKEQAPVEDENFDWQEEGKSGGSVFDIDPSDSDRWCQYIGYKGPGLSRISYVRVHHNHITDTELQTAKFLVLPSSPTSTTAPTSVDTEKSKTSLKLKRTLRQLKSHLRSLFAQGLFDSLPPYYKNWLYPQEFYNPSGWKGHYLHTSKHYWQLND